MAPNSLKRASALFVVGLLAIAGCSSGSDGKDAAVLGTLTGTVTGSAGALAGVVVTPSPAAVPAAVTDSSGKYTLSVPAGTYALAFTGDNLEPATASGAVVTSGATTTVDQVMTASTLTVTVSVPAALRFGGPAGFNTSVTGIAAVAKVSGTEVTPDSVEWSIADYYGTAAPPTAAEPSPSTGATTSFAIPSFEEVRTGANLWMSNRYGTAGTADDFEYIQAPERDQLLSFGVQQVRAMSYKVIARVTAGGRVSTGSAVIAPVTTSSGANTLPLGMMVVANAPSTATYAWTLGFLPLDAESETYTDVTASLQGADTKNPYLVPTESGVYKLTNGSDASLYFRINTFHGAGTADTQAGTDGSACSDCHGGPYSLAGKFAEWNNSAHGNFNWKDPLAAPASLFKLGVTGFEGTHYTESCISCHVVGYSKVPSAVNGGFDDVAADTGWTFPTTYDAAAWDTVTGNPDVLHRAGIQCESCHGPLEKSHGEQPEAIPSLFARPLAPGVSMSAGICLNCHDALTHHDRGSLWAASGHAKMDLVLADGTVEGRGTNAAHCGRCHAAEGFAVYLPQQQAGTPGNIARPSCTEGSTNCVCTTPGNPATCSLNDTGYIAYLSGLGLNTATAHSQTCQTCHDPHSTELRLSGDTKTVAAGFNYKGAGAGALCIVCHNSRITAPIYNDSDKTSYSAPHVASQGDIFAGRNAYFYGPNTGAAADSLPNKTAHSFMANACADCHVKFVPADIKAQYQVWNTNHTFRTSLEVCAECHAPGIGERIQEQVEEKLTSLSNSLGLLYRAKINAGGTDSMVRYIVTDGAVTDNKLADAAVAAGSIQRVVLAEFHGQPAIIVTQTDGTVFGNNLTAFRLTATTLFPVTSAAQKISAKAFYNYLLVHGGAAEGVHNPAYVNGVLDATIAQVATVSSL